MRQGLSYELAAVMPNVVAETGLFTSLCTIELPDGVLSASGQPSGVFVAVDGLVDIPCTAPPMDLGDSLQATEEKGLEQILALQLVHVLLPSYFPQLIEDAATGPGIWRNGGRAVIDGVNYDIMGAEADSQKIMTRLRCRISSE